MIPGFLLLSSHLGDPERRILTPAQLRLLTQRMQEAAFPSLEGELTHRELRALGYGDEMADRILGLLQQRDLLELYLSRAEKAGCYPLTRGDDRYPALMRRRLGGECPGCLFCKGDPEILSGPAAALVGSRDLSPENWRFAREAGRQAALAGVTLVSGNARGADRTAQNACLEAGGRVISIVADSLTDKAPVPDVLWISQEDFDAPFSRFRALSRNRLIHAMGYLTLVAQCSLDSGGTWSGTTQNLKALWSPVAVFRDGSPASLELEARGASLIDLSDLQALSGLQEPQMNFLKP